MRAKVVTALGLVAVWAGLCLLLPSHASGQAAPPPAVLGSTGLATPVTSAFGTCAGTLGTGTYYYRVTAFNAVGHSLASTEQSKAITGPLGVSLVWATVSGATGYLISGRGTGTELGFAVAAAGATTYCDDGSIVTPAAPLAVLNTSPAQVAAGTLRADAMVAIGDDAEKTSGFVAGQAPPSPGFLPRGLYIQNTAPGVSFVHSANTFNKRHYDIYANLESGGPTYSILEFNSANDDGSNVQTICAMDFYNLGKSAFSCGAGGIGSSGGFVENVPTGGGYDFYATSFAAGFQRWSIQQSSTALLLRRANDPNNTSYPFISLYGTSGNTDRVGVGIGGNNNTAADTLSVYDAIGGHATTMTVRNGGGQSSALPFQILANDGTTNEFKVDPSGNTTAAGSMSIGGGATINKPLTGTVAVTGASVTAGACGNQGTAITTTGAAAGDACFLGLSASPGNGLQYSCITSSNACQIVACNASAGSLTSLTGTHRCFVIH